MTKTITKISVETKDDAGKLETTHLHEGNMESIHWKKLGHTVGEVTGAVLKGVADGASS